MTAVKEKFESAFSGRQTDSFQGEITAVFLTASLILVNEHNNPLLLRERRHGLTEKSLTNLAI